MSPPSPVKASDGKQHNIRREMKSFFNLPRNFCLQFERLTELEDDNRSKVEDNKTNFAFLCTFNQSKNRFPPITVHANMY
ncbi:hypothetical protein HS088_TW03G00729 [Tripterygium wilfordii]|uniref:Uncharacterized protein n=1 Tax=Tripterygium wilfordii TaxID=458696 RepID=A0A7J7DVR9_TRIWF|nr:hypothetical protein HS088_TW03G00729 [Tripterygium wilfordii]